MKKMKVEAGHPIEEKVEAAVQGVVLPETNKNYSFFVGISSAPEHGTEMVLFQRITAGEEQAVLMPLLRVIPQYHLCLQIQRRKVNLKHRRRHNRFVYIPLLGQTGTLVPADAQPTAFWREVTLEERDQLLKQNNSRWSHWLNEFIQSGKRG